MPGNPSFDGAVAFAIEHQLKKDWISLEVKEFPLLRMIKQRKINFNTAAGKQSISGNSVLLPIIYLGPTVGARYGSSAGAYTPISNNPTQGFTQAQYFYARAEAKFDLDAGEMQLLMGSGPDIRTNIYPGKVTQLMNNMYDLVNTSLVSTDNGTGTQGAGNGLLTGQRQMLSTSNTVGGIPQGTYANWQAGTVPNAGPFYEGLYESEYDRIKNLGRGRPDFFQLSFNATNNVFGKVRDIANPKQLLVDEKRKADFGWVEFVLLGMDCWMDGYLGTASAGSAIIGRADTWWLNQGSERPVPSDTDPVRRIEGTTTTEYMYQWWLVFGNSDPAGNTLITGINP